MESKFKKYELYNTENGRIISVNGDAMEMELVDESFELFKSLYNKFYGLIDEDENLISIHTGGWSENEELIREFEMTVWWFKYHQITTRGGHYYFNRDLEGKKEWKIVKKNL